MSTAFRSVAVWLSFICLLFAPCSSAPVSSSDEPTTLSAANFNSTIESGLWWVKFFSPYCVHCQQLAPKWNKVYQKKGVEAAAKNFNFANVNCVTDGDLCDRMEILGYPSLNLYENGTFVETFKKALPKVESEMLEYVDSFINESKRAELEETKDEKKEKDETIDQGNKDNAKESKEAEAKAKDNKDEKVKGNKEKDDNTKETNNKDSKDVKENEGAKDPKEKEDTKVKDTQESDKSIASKVSLPTVTFPSFPSSSDQVNSVYPDTPIHEPLGISDTPLPNLEGKSIPLDHTTFSRKVTATNDGWFVKFYSPRCGHCREMAAAWNQMAKNTRGFLNVGEVNCDVERQLCKDADVRGYPKIVYFAGTIHKEYKGLRGYGDLISFAMSAVEARSIKDVNQRQFNNIVKGSGLGSVTFLYFYDKMTVVEDFQALEKLATSIVGNTNIYKTNDQDLIKQLKVKHFPSLYAVSEGRVVQYDSQSPAKIRDHEQLLAWARDNWLSLVPQLTPSNADDIYMHSKIIILTIVDPRDTNSLKGALKEMTATALEFIEMKRQEDREELMELRAKKQRKIDEAKDKNDKGAKEKAEKIKVEISKQPSVGLAWIDGVFWERWLKGRYGTSDVSPRVIINDEANGRFWDKTVEGDYITPSRSQVLDTLEAILHSPPKLRSTALHNSLTSYIVHIQETIHAHWFITSLVVIGLIVYYAYRRSAKYSGYQKTGQRTGLIGKSD